ncbi:MAG: hydrogenase formation protein HypD, partial [Elusimicrobiales bacterium]|nr:hydrogenase formation protein HypD [Elusimicrobiales bacterium]
LLKLLKKSMNQINEIFSSSVWSNPKIAIEIVKSIKQKAVIFKRKYLRNVYIMEVCGTHTMSIAKSGIRDALYEYVNLISGPGCPVCVTSQGEIDSIIELGEKNDVIITTFGDMMKVKGTLGKSLSSLRLLNKDVRVVYSAMDAINIACENPSKEVVFVGVGFETTAPTIAASVKYAFENGVRNFSIVPFFKLVPPALKYLVDFKIGVIDGFILPGHVSVIIGAKSYDFLREYNIPSVISGFEPLDILRSIDILLEKKINNQNEIINEYSRAVNYEGNKNALKVMEEVFSVVDSRWRAVGVIKYSGYDFTKKYVYFNALKKFNVKIKDSLEPKDCLCGMILLGLKKPSDCPLFGKRCRPEDAVGPCMVSSEGACAAWYKYGVKR